MLQEAEQYFLNDNGIFPNSPLPVLVNKKALDLSLLSPGSAIKRIFRKNNWGNNWNDGIYTYHHYHSVTHEAIGVSKGKTMLQLGGDDGKRITIEKGDVIIIPAGVAHKNLGSKTDVGCVGGYPEGKDFDMNYGKPEERPKADENIKKLPIPSTDPIYGSEGGLIILWNNIAQPA